MITYVLVRSSLVEEVKQLQHDDEFCIGKVAQVLQDLCEEFCVDNENMMGL